MKTEILISCDDWENRVAVLEEGSLAEIYFEREEKVIGSIYKGRVENVLPGMGACFVNIGLGRNAFLYVDDIMRDPINIGETEITDRRRGHTVNELLKVGSEVLVQIVKEPRGLKGARVSTNVSLPGRYLVLMPTGRYSGVSSRIEDPQDRERLKQIMRRVRPEGMATIVRTAAQGVSEAELIADLGVQLRLWHGILDSYKRSTAPALLHKDLNLIFKAVRDFLTSDVSAVYIDSKEQYDEIRSTMSLLGPQYIDRLKLVEGPGTLFAQRGIDEELQKLLKPKIPLPSGGHLVLEHTEALTVIDVNTGKFTGGRNLEDTIVRTNIEAAAEIARQVRLRDIGGIIVVDFIDMTHERNRSQVIQTLTDALRRDRTRSTIQEFSNLGLLEFTRKRVGKDLGGQLRSDCPYCTGLGTVMSSETVAIGVLRQIRGRVSKNGTRRLDVVADPGVATQLLGWYKDEFEKLARDHDIDIALYVEPQHHREQVVVEESRRMRAAPLSGSVVETELLAVRLPNPASGVAEINGYLIEVKDAANATGQIVKLKIALVEGNLVRAELAEPLTSAARRRRGQRGRGKDAAASDAPIAPPAPSLRDVGVPDAGRRRPEEAERRPSRLRRPETVAFSVADDEEDTPRVAVLPARAKEQPAPRSGSGRGRGQSGRGEPASRGGGRRRSGGGRGASASRSNALVVGGEGEVDYDDGDDDAVIATPAAPVARAPRPAEAEPAGDDSLAPKRRRRRGRGGRGRGGERVAGERAPVDGDVAIGYDDDETRDRAPRRALHTGDDTRAPRETPRTSYDEETDAEDDLGSVVDPRQPAALGRPPQKRYGPVRQLYGRPVEFDESRLRGERPSRDESRSRRPEGPGAPGRSERLPQPHRDHDDREHHEHDHGHDHGHDHDDELDVVIKPKGPAAIHVEMRGDMPVRRRPAHDDDIVRDREPREARGDRGQFGVERDRGPRVEREPPDRGPRVERDRVERGPGPRDGVERDRGPRVERDRVERGPGPRDGVERDRGPRVERDRGDRGPRVERGPERGPRVERDRVERVPGSRDRAEHERAPREERDRVERGPGPRDRVDGERAPEPRDRVDGERAPEPRDRGDRSRGPRGERPERGDRGGRSGGRSRDRERPPKREGPAIKQLYPPPGQEPDLPEEPTDDGTPPVRKPGFGRQPRGPMMRPAGAPPPPKGKVRQLYPPPPAPDETQVLRGESPSHERVVFDEAGDERNGSVFVSDADDHDERRRRARERADARRRGEVVDVIPDAGEGNAAKPLAAGTPETDEWPSF